MQLLLATAWQYMSHCAAFACSHGRLRPRDCPHDKVVDGAALSCYKVVDCAALCLCIVKVVGGAALSLHCLTLFVVVKVVGCAAFAYVDIFIFLCGFGLGTDIRESRKASSELSLKVGSDSFHSPWLLRCRCVCPGSTSTQLTCEPILGLGLLSLPPPSQTCCPSTTETRRI